MGVVANEHLEGRGFGFDVERAAFVSVLHRLFVSGSDRPCEKWMRDYAIDGIESLHLHHVASRNHHDQQKTRNRVSTSPSHPVA